MSNDHLITHGIKYLLGDLPTIREKKNPIIAGILGFLFGGIGLGLYFQSWKDFLYPILVMIGLTIIIPGIGMIVAIILTTFWGIFRAANSG
jgi:hypothetical protein